VRVTLADGTVHEDKGTTGATYNVGDAYSYTNAYGPRETIAHRESRSGRSGFRPLKVLTISGSSATLKTNRPVGAEIILGRALCIGTESNSCESSHQKSSEFHNCGYIIELILCDV